MIIILIIIGVDIYLELLQLSCARLLIETNCTPLDVVVQVCVGSVKDLDINPGNAQIPTRDGTQTIFRGKQT